MIASKKMNQQTPSNIYLAHCKQDLIDTIMLDYEVLNEIYPIVAKNDLTPIYTPKKDKPFYIAGFTSNSGAIIDKAIELQKHIKSIRGESPYE